MIIFLLIAVILVFKVWFGLGLITSGDYGFFYPEQIRQYFNLPFAWESFRGSGLGGTSFISQGVYLYNLPLGFLGQYFSFPVLERIVWLYPLLILGIVSPYLLAGELNLFPRKFYPLAIIIFFLNTYFFMIMGGGQLTVVLAYLTVPLVFTFFLKAFKKTNLANVAIFSLLLSVLIAWDFRIAYLYFIANFLYLFFLPWEKETFRKIILIFPFSFLTVFGLHAFWLLPLVLNFSNPVTALPSSYTSSEAVNFFSFAQFPQAFSLLHPNWPENIFGKTYFMRWEFLIMPVLAYSSLVFIGNKAKILFLVLIGLTGAFLAKGSNEPLGGIYLWLFEHLPGMVMFRDPTKFYTLTALSYSMLIPFVVGKIDERLSSQFKVSISKLFLLLTTIYLLLLIRPAWMGQLGGTFKTKTVPSEYLELKNFIADQPEFFRTFLVPVKQRFTFYSDNHPAIDAADFLQVSSASGVVQKLKNKETERLLSLAGVKYVILPYDSEGEIFVKDRKYDQTQRKKTEEQLNKISFLQKLPQFKLNAVYQTSGSNDRFWLEKQSVVNWKMVNPTKYLVSIRNLKEPMTLVFSENYDPGWVMKLNGEEIKSEKIYNRLNSFRIGKNFNGSFYIEFRPQRYLVAGLLISVFTIFLFSCLLLSRVGKHKIYFQ